MLNCFELLNLTFEGTFVLQTVNVHNLKKKYF